MFTSASLAVNLAFFDVSIQALRSSDNRCYALLERLFQADKTMPIMLPQQLLSLLVRNPSHILANISIVPKVPARLKLPEHSKKMIVALWRSEAENPVTVARRVNERGDVQFRIVGDVDEVLRRELR